MSSNSTIDFKIFDNYPEVCLVISGKGEILNYNAAMKNKLGFTDNELQNKSIYNFISESYQEIFNNALNKNFVKESPNVLIRVRTKADGEDVGLSCSFLKLNGSENIFVLTNNVWETDELQKKFKRFYTIAEKSVNPIQITDKTGQMIYVNPAYLKVSEYSEKELIGGNPKIFGSGKQSKMFWQNMWDTIMSGNVWSGEIEERKKSGEPFYSQAVISPIIEDDGTISGFFAVHNDITEKKMLEKKLIHSQKMESIGILTAGIAHEVGNPLSSISALVQVVLRNTKEGFVKEKLEIVITQVKRISKTIRDLVDFSRPSEYVFKLIDINKCIERAVEITKAGVKLKKIDFVFNLSNEIPRINLVPDQLEQVFVNILLNAIDAINEDHKNLNRIIINSQLLNDKVIIEFEDTGIGIDDEKKIKVFEPFFTTKEQGKGTGLGLWISYGIINSFQGEIRVESSKGIGSKFIITLPIK